MDQSRATRTTAEQHALVATTLVFAALGFSLVLMGQLLLMGDRLPFLLYNQLGDSALRMRLLLVMASGVVLPTVATVLVAWRRPALDASLIRWAKRVSPLVLLPLVPAIFDWRIGHQNTLFYLSLLALVAVALRYALEQMFSTFEGGASKGGLPTKLSATLAWLGEQAATQRLAKVLPFSIVVVAALGYAAYMSYYTILNHRLILTTGFDLGIYDNLMYNALEGSPFRSPVLFGPGDRNYLAGHAEFAMLLFLPFYAIQPGAETMLIIQSSVLGLAAIPLYLFARTRLSRLWAMLLSLVYLLFAPLHQPNFYDFHWLPLAIFFHFWLYYALATKRNWLLWPMMVILLMVREDVSVGLALLGVFIALTQERVRLGITMTVVSVLWFVAVKFVIMPSFGQWWFQGMYYGLFADGVPSYGSVIQTLVTNPIYSSSTLIDQNKLTYFLHMTAPLAFLPVRRFKYLWLTLPGVAFTILTTGYWPTVSIRFQYTSHWIPYLFLATVLSLHEVAKGESRSKFLGWAGTLVLCALSHSYNFGAMLQREQVVSGFSAKVWFTMNDVQKTRYEALRSLVDQIPEGASVAATEYLNPHISTRKDAYTCRYEFGSPDYVLVTSLEVVGEQLNWLRKAFQKTKYGLLDEAGNEFYLFKRGHDDLRTSKALIRLRLPMTQVKPVTTKANRHGSHKVPPGGGRGVLQGTAGHGGAPHRGAPRSIPTPGSGGAAGTMPSTATATGGQPPGTAGRGAGTPKHGPSSGNRAPGATPAPSHGPERQLP